jgi:hypothetical protein
MNKNQFPSKFCISSITKIVHFSFNFNFSFGFPCLQMYVCLINAIHWRAHICLCVFCKQGIYHLKILVSKQKRVWVFGGSIPVWTVGLQQFLCRWKERGFPATAAADGSCTKAFNFYQLLICKFRSVRARGSAFRSNLSLISADEVLLAVPMSFVVCERVCTKRSRFRARGKRTCIN